MAYLFPLAEDLLYDMAIPSNLARLRGIEPKESGDPSGGHGHVFTVVASRSARQQRRL
jgi:hypothetical protein